MKFWNISQLFLYLNWTFSSIYFESFFIILLIICSLFVNLFFFIKKLNSNADEILEKHSSISLFISKWQHSRPLRERKARSFAFAELHEWETQMHLSPLALLILSFSHSHSLSLSPILFKNLQSNICSVNERCQKRTTVAVKIQSNISHQKGSFFSSFCLKRKKIKTKKKTKWNTKRQQETNHHLLFELCVCVFLQIHFVLLLLLLL